MDLKSGPDPPALSHTHSPPPASHPVWLLLATLLVLRDFTQVCQFRWMRREGTDVYWAPAMIHVLWWCGMKSWVIRKLRSVERVNQTKAKVVRCQHPEVPFQRDFPRLFKVGLSFFPLNWLYWVFVAAPGLSRVAASRGGQPLVGVCRLLTAAASPVVQHGF